MFGEHESTSKFVKWVKIEQSYMPKGLSIFATYQSQITYILMEDCFLVYIALFQTNKYTKTQYVDDKHLGR